MALRNITLSADAELIDLARRRAAERGSTLNAEFRAWLERFTARDAAPSAYDNLMRKLATIHTDQPFER